MRTIAQPSRSMLFGAWFLAVAALLACGSARAVVVIEGVVDCRDWTEGRADHTSVNLEHYVLGVLNGLALGRGREFWRAGGNKLSPQQAYQWMDNYCKTNPQKQVMTGAGELFEQRTGFNPLTGDKKGP